MPLPIKRTLAEPTHMIPANLASLRIVLFPDPILKKMCEPVEQFDDSLRALADRMLELMREAKGVGLAAPQVGQAIRLFVSNVTGEPGGDLICVNPRLSDCLGAEEAEEGCLSLPGVTVTMRRATKLIMEAMDATGKAFKVAGEDLQARVWQHEADHLDGRLIVENMSPADEIANRRALKQLKDDYRPKRRGRR